MSGNTARQGIFTRAVLRAPLEAVVSRGRLILRVRSDQAKRWLRYSSGSSYCPSEGDRLERLGLSGSRAFGESSRWPQFRRPIALHAHSSATAMTCRPERTRQVRLCTAWASFVQSNVMG